MSVLSLGAHILPPAGACVQKLMAEKRTIPDLLRGLAQSRRLIYLMGILLSLLLLWVHTSAPAPLASLIQRMDFIAYDQRFAAMPFPRRDAEYNIVIVDIDERSLQVEGQWPWDRFKLADLVYRLDEYGVLLTGFDVTFPEPQRNPLADLLERAELPMSDDDLPVLFEELIAGFDADQAFAQAMQDTFMDVVLALSFSPIDPARYGELPRPVVTIDPALALRLQLQNMSGYSGNIAVLQQAANGAGFMNQLPDSDGVVRRVPLVLRYQNSLYPTLALEMARVFFFEEEFSLLTHEVGTSVVVEGVRMGAAGQYQVPTDQRVQMLVPYVGPSGLGRISQYSYVSATDVLQGTVDAALLEDALVLVGTTAAGLFDLRATPLESVYPGVEVHANILNALLQSFDSQLIGADETTGTTAAGVHFPYKPVWEPGAMAVGLVVAGVILSLVMPLLGPALLTVFSLLLVAALIWGNFWLWANYRLDLSLTLPVLLVLLLASLNMVWGFLRERRTRQAIKGMFDQYVPPAHIDAMMQDPDRYSFDGESREMTVLFSDIRNFTSVSETLSASELKTLLNEFFTPITAIIFEHQGTIDKYVGDMVVAFWGAPLDDAQHREHAVGAALDMVRESERLRVELVERGFPEIRIGVGVNSGVMNVGDMGSEYRRSYTVLGDAVNLGSRLEGLTRFYGVQCLIGEETANALSGFVCRRIDRVQVKGKENAVQIWEPLCRELETTEEQQQELALWHEALDLYYQQRWPEAGAILARLAERVPGCRLYGVYIQRIAELESVELGREWDGVYRHTSK